MITMLHAYDMNILHSIRCRSSIQSLLLKYIQVKRFNSVQPIRNSLKKQKNLYKVSTPSIKPPCKFLQAYGSSWHHTVSLGSKELKGSYSISLLAWLTSSIHSCFSVLHLYSRNRFLADAESFCCRKLKRLHMCQPHSGCQRGCVCQLDNHGWLGWRYRHICACAYKRRYEDTPVTFAYTLF